jgi:hypothetical protein
MRQTPFALPSAAARLDMLAVIGSVEDLETAANTLAPPALYAEPFALRALGIVREDEALLCKAEERFAVLEMGWHAAQTATLVKLRKTAS